MIQGYQINSPYCGRNKAGTFICVCGKCRPLSANKGNDNGRESSNGGNRRDDRVDDEPPVFGFLP